MEQHRICFTSLIIIILSHDDVIKWQHFSRYWSFMRGNRRWPLDSLHNASDAELWCFLWSVLKQTIEQTIETPPRLLLSHCNVLAINGLINVHIAMHVSNHEHLTIMCPLRVRIWWSLDFPVLLAWTSRWTNSWGPSDIRWHDDHVSSLYCCRYSGEDILRYIIIMYMFSHPGDDVPMIPVIPLSLLPRSAYTSS